MRSWTAGDPRSLGQRESYKGPEKSEIRRELTEVLVERCPLIEDSGLLARCSAEDDYLDALVCALVARAASRGLTAQPETDEERRLAPVEGWIHLPTAGLSELASTAHAGKFGRSCQNGGESRA